MNLLRIENKHLSKLILLILFLFSICCFGDIRATAAGPSLALASESSNSRPAARFGHAMVFDGFNQQVILFGGSAANDGISYLSDTWVFNCTSNSWINLNPTSRPSNRMGHSMVYDPVNQQVILFGGWSGETWIFDPQNNQWTDVSAASVTRPSARHSAGMYFDPVNQKAILFGGYLNNDSHAGDTWIFDPINHTWTEVFPSSTPAARYGHSMVYDPINQRGILFGGRVTALQSDTWAYDYVSNAWTQLQIFQRPVARYWHTAAYDSNNESIILFGGDDEGPGRSRNDIWTFDLQDEKWTEYFPETKPLPRIQPGMTYDSLNQRILIFGGLGNDYSDSYDDTWSYNSVNNSWINLDRISSPQQTGFSFEFSLISAGSILGLFAFRRKKTE